ncbi:MAG: transcriptional regulator [Bacteroidetes bacterium 4484_249]|nr:MAG: transcriptional regulator [Bacteroidetes bacterium 4484_249]
MNSNSLSHYLKEKRKVLGLTQPLLAIKAGVGLRFIRDIEQGKKTLRMDKVNQVLKLFGQELGPVPIDRNKLIPDLKSKF